MYNQLIEAGENLTLCQKIGDVQEKLEKCKLPIYNPFCDLLAKWGVLYVQYQYKTFRPIIIYSCESELLAGYTGVIVVFPSTVLTSSRAGEGEGRSCPAAQPRRTSARYWRGVH